MGHEAAATVGPLELGGLSSTYDALVAAMSRVAEPDRRHLVIAWVKALDSMSAVRRSQAVREYEAHRYSGALSSDVRRQDSEWITPPCRDATSIGGPRRRTGAVPASRIERS